MVNCRSNLNRRQERWLTFVCPSIPAAREARCASRDHSAASMSSDRPGIGDVVVARLSPESVAILIVVGGAEGHRLHAPCQSVPEALVRARQIAATASVDVWHRTSATGLERIASYRRSS